MPTYEYKCKKCNKTFELFHSLNAKFKKKCIYCNSTYLEKLISTGVGVIFKGSGFYETDYKRNNSSINSPLNKTSKKKKKNNTNAKKSN